MLTDFQLTDPNDELSNLAHKGKITWVFNHHTKLDLAPVKSLGSKKHSDAKGKDYVLRFEAAVF